MAVPSSLFDQQRLNHIREPLREHLQGSNTMGAKKRQEERAHLGLHSNLGQRPSYCKEVDTAREELAHFRSKFDQWKMAYDREVGKTRQELAMLTPKLMGLGIASKLHHFQEARASRYNTPTNCSTPRSSDPTTDY
ncbi:hypothetical protein R1flu_022893 [Riccia fluitans]|uniref:Uncharacterized protein n=1 Tax=Riccia fluitans TaxID=41844 RepID=A0ABD1XTI5_9MARC